MEIGLRHARGPVPSTHQLQKYIVLIKLLCLITQTTSVARSASYLTQWFPPTAPGGPQYFVQVLKTLRTCYFASSLKPPRL